MNGKMNLGKLSKYLFLIMIGSFILAGVLFFSTDGINNFHPESGNSSVESIDTTETFKLNNISLIDIRTISSDINIHSVTTDEIKVHFHGDAAGSIPELVTKESFNTLDIDIKYPRTMANIRLFNISLRPLVLDIYLPETYSGEIKAHTTSGDFNADTLNLKGFSFNSVSGDLKVENLNSKQLTFKTTSGSIKVASLEGNVDFSTVSGDINVQYSNFNHDIKIETTSGDSKIILPLESGFALDFNTVSGEVKSEFPITLTGNTGRRNVKGTIGDGKNSIYVKTVSGDLDILK